MQSHVIGCSVPALELDVLASANRKRGRKLRPLSYSAITLRWVIPLLIGSPMRFGGSAGSFSFGGGPSRMPSLDLKTVLSCRIVERATSRRRLFRTPTQKLADRMNERSQVGWCPGCNDRSIHDYSLIDKRRTGVLKVRTSRPPGGRTLSLQQPRVRKNPWSMAYGSDDLSERSRLLQEVSCRGIGAEGVRVPAATGNDECVVRRCLNVVQHLVESNPAPVLDIADGEDMRLAHGR